MTEQRAELRTISIYPKMVVTLEFINITEFSFDVKHHQSINQYNPHRFILQSMVIMFMI